MDKSPFVDEGPLPGVERSRRDTRTDFPVIAREALLSWAEGDKPRFFPFQSWAAHNRFAYPPDALPVLARCGSAAEAFFVREFVSRSGATFDNVEAISGPDRLALQVPAGKYRIDAVVSRGRFRLAIEVDGLTFHHRTPEQVAADYLRQRRIVCQGFAVVRFTASEVFAKSAECWRQVNAIIEAHT